MAQHFAFFYVRTAFVHMKIGAADVGCGNFHDNVSRCDDDRKPLVRLWARPV
jgi:hypothetical protein